MAKLAFFGTPGFAVNSLRALVGSGHEVALVVCKQDSHAGRGKRLQVCPVKQAALAMGLPTVQPADSSDDAVAELVVRLSGLDLDAAVAVAYGPDIPERLISVPRHGFVMVHASLLPRWRGSAPIERALEHGDRETGVSLVRMTGERYAGDVYAAVRLSIEADDDAITLDEKLSRLAAELLTQELPPILAGHRPAMPQAHEGITIAHPIDPAERRLDWTRSAQEIVDKARALAARGSLKITMDGRGVALYRPQVRDIDHQAPAGRLLASTQPELVFACKTGAVAFAEVQTDAGARRPATEFLAEMAVGHDSELKRRGALVSAALRHLRVAEHLAVPGPTRSLDDAFYLAGFGPECVQAACLSEDWIAPALGHGFTTDQMRHLQFFLCLDARARRYLSADWGIRHPALNRWAVQSRYARTGSFDAEEVGKLLDTARTIVDPIVASLWADGFIDHGALH